MESIPILSGALAGVLYVLLQGTRQFVPMMVASMLFSLLLGIALLRMAQSYLLKNLSDSGKWSVARLITLSRSENINKRELRSVRVFLLLVVTITFLAGFMTGAFLLIYFTGVQK